MLYFTGVGSSHCLELGSCCAHFWAGKDLVLLDCGEDTFSSPAIQQCLQHCEGEIFCFVTHLHSDHVGSLATLCLYCHDSLHKTVHVCFPTGAVFALLSLMGVPQTHYQECLSFPYRLENGLEITPIRTRHVPWMDCYGFLLNDHGSCIYYSGDANCLPQSILGLLQSGKLSLLYQDVTLHGVQGGPHMRLQDLCGIVPETALRERIVLMHFDCLECIEEGKRQHFLISERKETQ